ncbi:MAG: recombinase family protein [Chitinophagaceae bacterium]
METKKSTAALEKLLQERTVSQYKKEVKREKKFAVVYTRVSSQEQADNNSSLETQLKICSEYAGREGLVIKQFFGGTYESAKNDERTEFQRMLACARKDKEIAFIIVYNYDRFSRTGALAAQLCTELAAIGITVRSALQPIDSTTPTGKLQENLLHLFNNYDNQQRSSRTSTNTKEVMLKGYWTYQTPMGYDNLKAKHRACEHQYVINDAGKWLKKAFVLKAEGVLTNIEIIEQLNRKGVPLTEKNFRWVISNPFYAGYITGKLVNGKLIKGHHPALIDLKTFVKANSMLMAEPNTGIAKTHQVEEAPLKIFVKDEISACPLTAYLKKGHWYYKARNKPSKLNINAVKLNNQFETLLSQFEYKKEYKDQLKKTLVNKLNIRLGQQLRDGVQLRKRITELKNQLETIEERFALGTLTKDLFEKVASKKKAELVKMEQELGGGSIDSSNLNLIVEKGLEIAEKLSQLWVSRNFINKQRLQYLVFPMGILYNKEKGAYRTEQINPLFAEIPPLVRVLEKKEKGNLKKNCLKSCSVPHIRFLSNQFIQDLDLIYSLKPFLKLGKSFKTNQ